MADFDPDTARASHDRGPSEYEPTGTVLARRALRVLLPVAVVAVAFAVLANWLALPRGGEALPSAPLNRGGDVPPPEAVVLTKPALDLLPDRVLQYETITRQSIPGQDDRGAEAIYKTLSMNVEAQIPTVVYGRVEGLASSAAAEQRLEEFTAEYTKDRHQEPLGTTIATVGWTEDQAAFVFAWTEGQYVTFVKASFAQWVPEHTFEIIERQGRQVAEAVRVYQETGRQGITN